MTLDLLVLGGGFTGLAIAHRARARGLRVKVWEACDRVGGWVQTRDWPDREGRPGSFDLGPQGLRFPVGSALETLCRDLHLPLFREEGRGPRWMRDASGDHPLARGLGMLAGLPLGHRLRVLLEPFRGPLPPGPASLADLARHRFGTGFAERLWPALIQGLAGAPPSSLDLDFLPALRRLDGWGGVLRQAFAQGTPRRWKPEGGMGQLTGALARDLEVLTGQEAVALAPLARGWEVRAANGTRQAASRVILALPAHAAAPLLAPHAPLAARALATLPHTDLWVRHSRHAPVTAWAKGFTLLVHPEVPGALLGATSLPWRQEPWMQVRTLGTGPCALDLPDLGAPLDTVETMLPRAFPRPRPGELQGLAQACSALPSGLEACGAWRWGPGLADLAQGVTET